MERLIFSSVHSILLIAAIIVLVSIVITENKLVINTNSGDVQGIIICSEISTFYAFFSIPYAKPPLGELRFQAPKPIEPWEDIHDGTVEGPSCPQRGTDTSNEDCLTLSLYTNNISKTGRPVYVWLHGGALEYGSAKFELYGPHYFMKHDIVVITLQFRLNVLGFLHLGSEDAPGNMGLMDVLEALKWIQENVGFFGGDPNNICLGGFSSGAIMVHALMLSPRSRSLFRKVIIQSGTSLSYRFYQDNTTQAINKLKESINMTGFSNSEVLDYLKNRTVTELLDINDCIKTNYSTGYAEYYPFVITRDFDFNTDGPILPKNPLEIMRSNNYTHLPMMIGFTSNEGIRLESYMSKLDYVDEHFHVVVPTDLYDIDDMSEGKMETARTIKQFYFGNKKLSNDTFLKYTELCTDSWYAHITDYVVRLQSYLHYNRPIFYYIFGVDGAYNYQKIANNYTSYGPSHGDDIGYMWVNSTFNYIVPQDAYSNSTRNKMVKMWSNFIKYGNPTPGPDSLLSMVWQETYYPKINYLLINETLSMEEKPFRDRLSFWRNIYGLENI